MTYATPPPAGVQPPAPEPLCGTPLPSIPGAYCDDPAVWHIRWEHGTPDAEDVLRPSASLACGLHADEYARDHAWYERHPATAACSSADPTWQPTNCTTTDTTGA